MITNERQYKVSRSQAARFEQAIRTFNELALIEQGLDPLLIKAQKNALQSQFEELTRAIGQYEVLKSGKVKQLSAKAIGEIGYKLIEARIAQGLSQKELADRLGMKEQQVQRYEQERYASASLSRIAEICAALDLDLQLDFTVTSDGNLEDRSTEKLVTIDTSKFPTKIMKLRGWLEKSYLGIKDQSPSTERLVSFFLSPAFEGQTAVLLKQGLRLGSHFDKYSLLAWKARIVWKARNETNPPVSGTNFSDLSWLKTFNEFTLEEDGPALAVDYLRRKGIFVVFEAHLPKTHLDGAALLVDERVPTVGLTLRHDRLDNFWFVLLHELGHIILHRESGLNRGFFDDDQVVSTEKLEREADDFAKSVLLPTELWLSSLVRFTQSADQVVAFARENRVSPAIIAGWIRRERNDYSIFNELVGYGKVRKTLEKARLLGDGNVSST
jgi:HTH-type transcriptional regulator/antitoxin HigA